ncbi:MAG: hypothetical protein SFU98_21240 [Leptospiraceae bacterium]|nr:hypothetical protein [Leptospiraceae bacterium]
MSIIKLTIFQKNINTPITKDEKTKLASQKSEFLVLPRFFPHTESIQALVDHESYSKKYLDMILEVSEYHKGVVIGGTMLRKEKNNYIESCPIVQDVNLIDYANLRSLDTVAGLKISKSESESIHILNGVRFAILIGKDFQNQELRQVILKEKIELIIQPELLFLSPDDNDTYQNDLKEYASVAKELNSNIVRVSGVGTLAGKTLSGRSLHASKEGIRWKVADYENNNSIIKTININIIENFPSYNNY